MKVAHQKLLWTTGLSVRFSGDLAVPCAQWAVLAALALSSQQDNREVMSDRPSLAVLSLGEGLRTWEEAVIKTP